MTPELQRDEKRPNEAGHFGLWHGLISLGSYLGFFTVLPYLFELAIEYYLVEFGSSVGVSFETITLSSYILMVVLYLAMRTFLGKRYLSEVWWKAIMWGIAELVFWFTLFSVVVSIFQRPMY